jgi:Raf kinase inhibitor-like YbhB/YbcL family protein
MRIPRLMLTALVTLCVPSASIVGQAPAGRGGPASVVAGNARYMTLTTTAFKDSEQIPAKYTQDGDQTSPALTWANAPDGTMSYVLYFHDLEVVRNKTQYDDQLHWLVWNIPPTTTSLPEGVPMGATLKDGSHQISPYGALYRGPGNPATNLTLHHYTFEIFALDTKLDIKASVDGDATANGFETRANVLRAMNGHIIGHGVLVGLFRRAK